MLERLEAQILQTAAQLTDHLGLWCVFPGGDLPVEVFFSNLSPIHYLPMHFILLWPLLLCNQTSHSPLPKSLCIFLTLDLVSKQSTRPTATFKSTHWSFHLPSPFRVFRLEILLNLIHSVSICNLKSFFFLLSVNWLYGIPLKSWAHIDDGGLPWAHWRNL